MKTRNIILIASLALGLAGCFTVDSQFGTIAVDRDPKGALSSTVTVHGDAIVAAWKARKKSDPKQIDETIPQALPVATNAPAVSWWDRLLGHVPQDNNAAPLPAP
jgi:hypothetical protein